MKLNTDPRLARLQIAADVILHVVSGALDPISGKIFGYSLSTHGENTEGSAQKFLKKVVKPNEQCRVCARGAVFIAHTLRFNKNTIADMDRFADWESVNELPEFSGAMLLELEVLFEGKIFDWTFEELGVEQTTKLLKYVEKNLRNKSTSERLIHIMGLLIKNQGEKILL